MRLLILMESAADRRVWDEVIPLLQARDVEATVGSVFGDGALQQRVTGLGCESFSLGAESSRDYPAAALRLARIIRSRRIGVVQGTEPIAGVLAGGAARIAERTLRVYHRQHDAFPSGSRLTTLSRWSARLAHAVLACSHSCARAAHELDGTSQHRIRVAHNGANRLRDVGASELAATRTQLGIPTEASVVSVVARLHEVKGIDVLLEAVPLIESQIANDVHVVIAGSGPQETSLRAFAAADSARARRVHFVGRQTDVALWLSLGDAVAMPSRHEAFGVVAAEAMACARPLVASAVGGLVEVVKDGETGLLVPPGDPNALAIAIAGVLTDPARAAALGTAARRRFEAHFTNEHMVDAWIRCYAEFLRRIRSSPRASRAGIV